MPQPPGLPIVLVEWLAPVPAPGTSEEAEGAVAPPTPRICRTVGFLVAEVADTLIVAQNLIPADEEVDMVGAGDTSEIPRFLVQRIRTILPAWFDRLTQAEQDEFFKLLACELEPPKEDGRDDPPA